MKKQTLYSIAVSALFLLFGSLSASAQTPDIIMTVQVPFDFQVGGNPLPAGRYTIKRDKQVPSFLRMECPEQKAIVIFQAMPLNLPQQKTQSSLTFKEYGDDHFLSEVKFPGYGFGYVLLGSRAERKVAQSVRVSGL